MADIQDQKAADGRTTRQEFLDYLEKKAEKKANANSGTKYNQALTTLKNGYGSVRTLP